MRPRKSTVRRRLEAIERVEETATKLMFAAEQWTLTGGTLYDLKNRRESLLNAGRQYGYAIRALSRFK